jgi:tRNA (adenine37-N6)-methyltransferase
VLRIPTPLILALDFTEAQSMQFTVEPIGHVSCSRSEAIDDAWDFETSSIRLTERFSAEAILGLSEFSHVEILYGYHGVDATGVVTGARHPRGNSQWPLVGIFAQRAKNRPNRLGTTACRLLRIEGTQLYVAGLDAIDGTPVFDIKPVMAEFLPRGEVVQPKWSHELMSGYWDTGSAGGSS